MITLGIDNISGIAAILEKKDGKIEARLDSVGTMSVPQKVRNVVVGETSQSSLVREGEYPLPIGKRGAVKTILKIAENEVPHSLPICAKEADIHIHSGKENGSGSRVRLTINQETSEGDLPHILARTTSKNLGLTVTEECAWLGFEGTVVTISGKECTVALSLNGTVLKHRFIRMVGSEEQNLNALINAVQVVSRGSGHEDGELLLLGETTNLIVESLKRRGVKWGRISHLDLVKVDQSTLSSPAFYLAHHAMRTSRTATYGRVIGNAAPKIPAPSALLTLALLVSTMLMLSGALAKGHYLKGLERDVAEKINVAFFKVMPQKAKMIDPVFQLETELGRRTNSDQGASATKRLHAALNIINLPGVKIQEININDSEVRIECTADSLTRLSELNGEHVNIENTRQVSEGIEASVNINLEAIDG